MASGETKENVISVAMDSSDDELTCEGKCDQSECPYVARTNPKRNFGICYAHGLLILYSGMAPWKVFSKKQLVSCCFNDCIKRIIVTTTEEEHSLVFRNKAMPSLREKLSLLHLFAKENCSDTTDSDWSCDCENPPRDFGVCQVHGRLFLWPFNQLKSFDQNLLVSCCFNDCNKTITVNTTLDITTMEFPKGMPSLIKKFSLAVLFAKTDTSQELLAIRQALSKE